MTELLELVGVSKQFGTLTVLENLNATVKSGSALGVVGPNGAGKSTLVNRLVPSAQAATGEISKALHSGRHTTTSTHWYWLGAERGAALIDSPGFQEFGLHHLDARDLARFMPDMHAQLGDCKFYNCTHLHEPGCGVLSALQIDESAELLATEVSHRRRRIYTQLFEELGQQRW